MTGFMTTFTGKQFHFSNPVAEEIDIRDIAHHLSLLCHWNGACRQFFSVAQHSVLVSHLVNQNNHTLLKWALMHDAAEAYVGDMTRPLKVLLPEFKEIETRILRIIAQKFGMVWPEPPELKIFDNQALKIEADMLMPALALHDGYGNPISVPEGKALIKAFTSPWHSENAEGMFLQRYSSLFHC